MTHTDDAVACAFMTATKAALDQEYRRITHCLEQLPQEDVWRGPSRDVNCVGNIVLHLLGNLRQWFLHGLGGADDVRNRSAEFAETEPIAKEELLGKSADLVECITALLDRVNGKRLLEPRRIQGFDTTVLAAIYGTITHLEGHALQISYITHMLVGARYEPFWKPLTHEQGAE